MTQILILYNIFNFKLDYLPQVLEKFLNYYNGKKLRILIKNLTNKYGKNVRFNIINGSNTKLEINNTLEGSTLHIPDGYLSPHTSGLLYIISIPLWGHSLKKIRKEMNQRHIPLLAMLAAFSFLIMMFNIPLPGGTTGHAIGGVLIAILLGPWPALLALTLALAVQASGELVRWQALHRAVETQQHIELAAGAIRLEADLAHP